MTLYNGFLLLKPMLSAGLCKAVRQNARATPLGDRMGLSSYVLSPFFPQHTSYIVSHPKLHTPSQLFGTQEITTARGILGPNSPLSLSYSLSISILLLISQVTSPTAPHSQSYPFQDLIWESGLETIWVFISQCLTYQKLSITKLTVISKPLGPVMFVFL